MRVRVILTAAGLALAVPASAQEAVSASAEAEDALKCAMWASMLVGSGQVDDETQRGLGFALSYWIGKFEGLTGRHFEETATAEFVSSAASEFEALAPICGAEMQEIGQRMVDWGADIAASGL